MTSEAGSSVGAVIVGARLGPGHDGRAEIVVELSYPNGGRARLSVTEETASRCMDAAGLTGLDELLGRQWSVLVPELAVPPPTDIPASPQDSTDRPASPQTSTGKNP